MKSKAMGLLAAGLLAVFGFGSQARAETNIVLLANGFGEPNSYPQEQLPASVDGGIDAHLFGGAIRR